MIVTELDQSTNNPVQLYNDNLRLQESLALGILEGNISMPNQATKPFRLYVYNNRQLAYTNDAGDFFTIEPIAGMRFFNLGGQFTYTYTTGNGWVAS